MTTDLPLPPAATAWPPLERGFFDRPTDEVARDLLGCVLVSASAEGLCAGRIVETEAYGGRDDRASHARAGLTRRTAPMFGQVGHAYVYLVYGLHWCLNVVARRGADAGAVLLRAVEPIAGVELMRRRRRRPHDATQSLGAGPARLAQAFGVDRSLDGHDLAAGQRLWLSRPGGALAGAAVAAGAATSKQIAQGPRIGVAYSGAEWSAVPWRFWLAGNPAVSRR